MIRAEQRRTGGDNGRRDRSGRDGSGGGREDVLGWFAMTSTSTSAGQDLPSLRRAESSALGVITQDAAVGKKAAMGSGMLACR
jgi:hypothetical protein